MPISSVASSGRADLCRMATRRPPAAEVAGREPQLQPEDALAVLHLKAIKSDKIYRRRVVSGFGRTQVSDWLARGGGSRSEGR
jgi:hypothetical protein